MNREEHEWKLSGLILPWNLSGVTEENEDKLQADPPKTGQLSYAF